MPTPNPTYTRADGSPPQDGDVITYDIEIGPHYVPLYTPTFNREAGLVARDKAVTQVSGNTDSTWRDAARDAVRSVASWHQEFTTDEVWQRLEDRGIAEPHENRAMGPIMMWAVKQHICRTAEKQPRLSSKTVNHGRRIAVYDSLICGTRDLDGG